MTTATALLTRRLNEARRAVAACKVPGLTDATFAPVLTWLVDNDPWGDELHRMSREAAQMSMATALSNLASAYARTGEIAPVLRTAIDAVTSPSPAVTVESVTAWTWVEEPNHRGKVPTMPKAEREALVELEEARAMRRLSESEWNLYRALRRKLEYRAARDTSPRCF